MGRRPWLTFTEQERVRVQSTHVVAAQHGAVRLGQAALGIASDSLSNHKLSPRQLDLEQLRKPERQGLARSTILLLLRFLLLTELLGGTGVRWQVSGAQ